MEVCSARKEIELLENCSAVLSTCSIKSEQVSRERKQALVLEMVSTAERLCNDEKSNMNFLNISRGGDSTSMIKFLLSIICIHSIHIQYGIILSVSGCLY